MQKYRRFTDEATGINPFIKAEKSDSGILTTLIFKPIAFLLKLFLVLSLIFFRVIFLIPEILLPSKIHKSYVSVVNRHLASLFLYFAGMLGADDYAIDRCLINNPDPRIVLMNNSCALDGLICLWKLSPVEFAVFSRKQDTYTIASRTSLLLRFFSNTGFISTDKKGLTLEEVYEKTVNRGKNLVLFFEGVRTTGDGVLASQTVIQQITQLKASIVIMSAHYKTTNPKIRCVTSSALVNLYNVLTTRSVFVKFKVKILHAQSLSLVSTATKEIFDFYQMNGLKKITKNVDDYYQFMEFYRQQKKS